jgi:hypothetical protein
VIAGGGSSRGRWDGGDVARRLCAALDVARQSVERLGANGYTDPEEPTAALRPEKLIGETAILLYAASAVRAYSEVGARVDSMAQLLIPHARSARMLLGICLEPSLALDYAEAHICLSKLGYRDAGFDELLRQSLNSQAGAGRERVPYRALEQHWICGIWMESTSAGGDRPASPVLDSVLKRPLDLLGRGKDEAYAFTHALMYLRDFNIRPRRLPRARALILAEAEAALARCLDQEDYDLGGEMLMAWPLTGAAWSAGAAFGFRVLARLEDKNGVLSPPRAPPQRLDKLEGRARTDYLLATSYHTTYVMGLLCAAALYPGRAPPARLPARRGPQRGAAGAILKFLDCDGRRPHWRHELEEISSSEREALAGFLLDIALCRKIGRREFAAAHEILRTGYALGLANRPASSQAAETLERLATFERISGKSASAQCPGGPDASTEAPGRVSGLPR